MKSRSNRILTWAIALSLAAHFVLIYWAQDLKQSYADTTDAPKVITIEQPRVKPTPPPFVPPPPVARPLHRQHARVDSHIVAQVDTHRAGPPQPPTGPIAPNPPGPDLGPPGPPEPTIVPQPSCDVPDVDAKATRAITPDTPEAAAEEGITGDVSVSVTLDENGDVLSAGVYKSSGSPILDNAAVMAAKKSSYTPAERDCATTGGTYLFTVTFQ